MVKWRGSITPKYWVTHERANAYIDSTVLVHNGAAARRGFDCTVSRCVGAERAHVPQEVVANTVERLGALEGSSTANGMHGQRMARKLHCGFHSWACARERVERCSSRVSAAQWRGAYDSSSSWRSRREVFGKWLQQIWATAALEEGLGAPEQRGSVGSIQQSQPANK